MLTIKDEPSIRNGIMKRLGKEPGIGIAEIKVKQLSDCIRVGVVYTIDNKLIARSLFDLPHMFYYKHLHNEIDEICEQAKMARTDYGFTKATYVPEKQLPGTGLRGRWNSLDGPQS